MAIEGMRYRSAGSKSALVTAGAGVTMPSVDQFIRFRRKFRCKLGCACDVPEYQRRPYILDYYRLEPPAVGQIFAAHNETLNVWTHLLGALYFLLRGAVWVAGQWHDAQNGDGLHVPLRFPVTYYLLVGATPVASAICMTASSLFHWRSCSAPKEYQICLCLDRSCVLLLIVESCFTGTIIFFECHRYLQMGYLTMSTCLCGTTLATMIMPSWKKYQSLSLKATLFECIPIVHWFLCSYGKLRALWWGLLFTAFFYSFGVIFLVTGVPERWSPGKFDLVGQSHQIWHICVFLGAAVWLETVFAALDVLKRNPGLCAV